MIILNTTFYIHESIDCCFRQWIRDVYLPSGLNDGKMISPGFSRLLLEPQDGMSGYAVQLSCDNYADAEAWHDGVGGDLRAVFQKLHGQKILFFTTYMDSLPL